MTAGQLKSILDRELQSGILSVDSEVVLETEDFVCAIMATKVQLGPSHTLPSGDTNRGLRRLVLLAKT
jgi:hypothetical protein